MRRWIVAGVLLAVAVIGGAGYLGMRQASGAQMEAVTAPPTVPVGRGEVQESVTAPGHLVAARQATLSMAAGGRLAELNVHAGDHVGAGQVLARLDDTDLALQLQNAQADLRVAQAKLAQTRSPATAEDIANGRARVESAQAAYDKVAAGASQTELASAQAQVASAQAAYDAAVKEAGTSNNALVSAAATLEKARVAVQQAQTAYDRVAWRADVGMSQEAQNLQKTTIDYEAAKAAYDTAIATADSDSKSKIASAAASLQSARASLAGLQDQASDADLTAAKATLTEAQNDLAVLLAGPEANALDIAQSAVDQAQIAVKQARLKLDGASLAAPFDGVVTEVNAGQGDTVAAGAALIVLYDPSAMEAVGTVVEEDLGLVQPGQDVDLFFDAQPDVPVKGHVSRIVPERDTSSDRTAYPVVIGLDEVPDGLLPGMTVDASIVIEGREDVLRLPRSLVRAGAEGKAVVQVWTGDHTEQRTIQVGLRGDVYVEITDGLMEGEQVVGQ